MSSERGSFPDDRQENRSVLSELGDGTKTKFFLIREEFNKPCWALVLWQAKGQVSFQKPFLCLHQQAK